MSETNVLLTPSCIGTVEIKNRIVMAPMTTRLADRDGFVTDNTIDYYNSVVAAMGGAVHQIRGPGKEVLDRAAAAAVPTDRSVVASLGVVMHACRFSAENIQNRPSANAVSTKQSVVAALGLVIHVLPHFSSQRIC